MQYISVIRYGERENCSESQYRLSVCGSCTEPFTLKRKIKTKHYNVDNNLL